ncbi:DegT/DnrJ/EryC1/StrS family aminotransferase, partial [Vibrio sp. 10N.261.49.A5]
LESITNSNVVLPSLSVEDDNVWHVFPVRVQNRNDFMTFLKNRSIETLIHYPIPPHKQKAYIEWKNQTLPITEEIHETIVSLPISPVMTLDEAKVVIEAINEYQ